MKNKGASAVLSAVLITLSVAAASAQTRTRLGSYRLANVYRLELPAKTYLSVRPSAKHGLVWVAITDGIVEVGRVEQAVKQGAAEWQEGAESVGFRAPDAKAAQFVVVDLSAVSEEVMINNWSSPSSIWPPDPNDPTNARTHHQESLEPGITIDAVHTPEYLLVAVAPLILKVQLELSEEGEPRRMARPTIMRLAAGGVQWLKPGPMLITNVGKTNARFVEIGWIWRVK